MENSGELTLSSASKKRKHIQLDSSSLEESTDGAVPLKTESDSTESMNIDGSSTDLSYHDDEDDNYDDDENYFPDYDYDQDMYDDHDQDVSHIDEYALLQAKYDNMDIPPGLEVSFPFFGDPRSIPGKKTLTISDVPKTEKKESATSSSTVHADSSSNSNEVERNNVDSTMGMPKFKNFDVVDDFSDHHFSQMGFSGTRSSKNWAKKVLEEWKILENDLPDTIFVRVCEARMELLRAVITGPSGTPYHDGLFVFDCLFPTNYPSAPPSVFYYSGGLRLNPNLYNCGKVCLSLLGTWAGSNKNENWVPGKSTMLQVLVSIQALILNSRPYFNEPGRERLAGPLVERKSKKYNEDVFILSMKTMIYTIRRPPKHFEELIVQHFRDRAHDILTACKAYTEGALVGSNVKDGLNNQDKNSGSNEFNSKVAEMMNFLVATLSRHGTPGCEEF